MARDPGRTVTTPRILFLPGAGGSAGFWRPVCERLPIPWRKVRLNWPGLGAEPHDHAIAGMDDLVALALSRMEEPMDIVAQSMGGVVAARIALEHPEKVRRLVLVTTSGGVDVRGLGGSEWRADYRATYPSAAAWITEASASPDLPVEKIMAPTMLIWGDADTISPPAVGEHLASRIPGARLTVLPGGDHDLAVRMPEAVAALVAAHLD